MEWPPNLPIDEGVVKTTDGRWIMTFGKDWRDRSLDTLDSHTLAFIYGILTRNGAPDKILMVVQYWGVRNLTDKRLERGTDDPVLNSWIAMRKMGDANMANEILPDFDIDGLSPVRQVAAARAILNLSLDEILEGKVEDPVEQLFGKRSGEVFSGWRTQPEEPVEISGFEFKSRSRQAQEVTISEEDWEMASRNDQVQFVMAYDLCMPPADLVAAIVREQLAVTADEEAAETLEQDILEDQQAQKAQATKNPANVAQSRRLPGL